MFSIRTLFVAVAIVAIGVVGLTTRNVWWASVFATLMGIGCRGNDRRDRHCGTALARHWLFCLLGLLSGHGLSQQFQNFASRPGYFAGYSCLKTIDLPTPQPPPGSSGYSAIIEPKLT
jgi:hypothetical protein